MKKLFYNVLAFIRMLKAEVKNMKKEQDLDALIQPIRKWLSGAEQERFLKEGKTICICLDIFSPVERRQPIEYEEAWRFELPCLRMEQFDTRTGRLIKRNHTTSDEIDLPLDPLLLATK